MPKRTEIVCIHEGENGKSIDPIFARAFLKECNPNWVRITRFVGYGDNSNLIENFTKELHACIKRGGDTTLIVLADVDDDRNGYKSCEELKAQYHNKAKAAEIADEHFNKVIFILPKDRLENWIEFINTGSTDENKEGPRIKEFAHVAEAAKKLAKHCNGSHQFDNSLPPSLQWSCCNWKALVERMRS